MKRTPMVAGNWKMNKGIHETRDLIREMFPVLHAVKEVEVVICPPFVGLGVAKRELEDSSIKLGAQNMHWSNSGAFTGEISPVMLKELCEYVILGHSERRAMFGETDETVNKKVLAALANGLKPIVCVGETLEENQSGITAEVVGRQVRADLQGLTQEQAELVVIAYEPVWAIGTGETATPEQAEETHVFVRSLINKSFGPEAAQALRIQYGGSVKPDNARDLIACPNIDGFLVGGAALQAESFAGIINACL